MKRCLLLFLLTIGLTVYVNAQQWVVYDGSVSPDSVFELNGSGALIDTIINDPVISGNKLYEYLVGNSEQFNWRANLNANLKGITVVTRVKADLIDTTYTLNFSLRNGEVRADIRLEDNRINPDKTIENVNYNLDMSKWHIVRITLANDSAVKVYVDEDATPVMIDTANATVADLYLQWGDGSTSSSYGGLVDWLIFDTTGVYAPDEGMAIPDSLFTGETPSIIFITPDGRDSTQIDWLNAMGYNVTVFNPVGGLAAQLQSTIDWMNSADLIIVGRSPNSGDFDAPDKSVWNGLTAPMILNTQWASRNSRLNWFNSGSCIQINSPLDSTIYAHSTMTTDPVFAGVTFDGDSIPWSITADDYLALNDTIATNAEILAGDVGKVYFARFDPYVEFYPGSFDRPYGYRTYFGFGNDAAGPAHFFPLTEDGMKVYAAEIQRMVALPEAPANNIIFITPDNRDSSQIQWLQSKGFMVTTYSPTGGLAAQSVAVIDMLNRANLIIVGRSPNSGDFDPPDKAVWNALKAPLILNTQWAARNSRLNWFNSGSAIQINSPLDSIIYAHSTMTSDPVFADVTFTGDSIPWSITADDYLALNDTIATNAEILAGDIGKVYFARFEPYIEFYPGSIDRPSGYRTYFGFGNDAAGPAHFFPLTADGQAVYLAEINRMLDLAKVPNNYVIFITPDGRDSTQIDTLNKLGYKIDVFNPAGGLSTQSAAIRTWLNTASVIIIGRSPNSGDFDPPDKAYWNAIKAPVILNTQWAARNSRLNWFNSGSAIQINSPLDSIIYAHSTMTSDPVFAGVTFTGDSIPWSITADDYLALNDTIPTNATVLADDVDKVYFARFRPLTEFYPGSKDYPSGQRTYFGFGNDAAGPAHFFPLTDDGKKVYFAEIAHITELPAAPLSNDANLTSLTAAFGTMTPAFDPAVISYELAISKDSASVLISATANPNATVTGAGAKAIGDTASIVVTADNKTTTKTYTVAVIEAPVSSIEEEVAKTNTIDLFPNPATNFVTVTGLKVNATVRIMNVVGQVVYQTVAKTERLDIDLSGFKNGIYIINTQIDGVIFNNKFIKQ